MLALNEWMRRHVAANDNVTVVQYDSKERVRTASVMSAPNASRFIAALGIGMNQYETCSGSLIEPDKRDKLLFATADGCSVLVQKPEIIEKL